MACYVMQYIKPIAIGEYLWKLFLTTGILLLGFRVCDHRVLTQVDDAFLLPDREDLLINR